MRKLWPKRIAWIVLAVIGGLLALLLMKLADTLGVTVESVEILRQSLAAWLQYLTMFLAEQQALILVEVIGSIVAAIVLALAARAVRRFMAGPEPEVLPGWVRRGRRFPFRCVEPSSILEEVSSYPEMEVPYVPRVATEARLAVERLASCSRVLFVGRAGIGKTREAAELVVGMDYPPGQVLVLQPEMTMLESSFVWPTDLPIRQRRVVLLLDNLGDFKAYDDDTNDIYGLKDAPAGFERVLVRLVRALADQCDDLRVIATIRLESKAWKRIERRTEARPWGEFSIYALAPHTWEEAIKFAEALGSGTKNIQLDLTARKLIADRFDGTFASIRDYVRIKEAAVVSPNGPVTLAADDVGDFVGVYPVDWEDRFYKPRIEKKAPARAIFAALGVAAEAQVLLHESVIVGLAARMISKRFMWYQEVRCKRALQDLDLWITKRNAILEVPKAYVEGRGSLSESLDDLAIVLHKLSRDRMVSEGIYLSLLALARVAGISFGRYEIGLGLIERALQLHPEDAVAWHALGLTYSKLGREHECIDACEHALELDPDLGQAYATMGVSLSRIRRLSDALQVLQRGRARFPPSARILVPLGVVLDRLNEKERSIAILRQATALEPENVSAFVALAISLHRSGHPNEAVEFLGQALTLQPDHRAAYRTTLRLFPALDDETSRRLIGTLSDVGRLYSEDVWACRALGKVLWQLGIEREARDQMTKAMSLELETADEYWAVGDLLDTFHEYEAATGFFERALELDPSHYKAHAGLGETLTSLGRLPDAVDAFKEAISIDPDVAFAWSGLGGALSRLGGLKEARDALRRAVRLDPHISFAWAALADISVLVGEPSEAESLFAQAVDADDKNLFAWIGLAMVQKQIGRSEEASQSFERAISLGADDVVVWMELGEALTDLGRHDEAVIARENVVRLMPKNALAWSFLASSLIKLERHKEAESAVATGEALAPESVSLACSRGMVELKLGRAEQALQAFLAATEASPGLAFAWTGLGQAYARLERTQDAFEAFSRATGLNSRDPVAWSGLGMTAMSMEEYDDAAKAFNEAIGLDPNHPLPWSHLGEALLKQQKVVQSVEVYRKAVELDAANSYSWSGLGHALNRLGQFEDAVEPHRHAINLGLDNSATWYGLGLALTRTQRWVEAAEALSRSLGHDPCGLALRVAPAVRANLTRIGKEGLVRTFDAALSEAMLHADIARPDLAKLRRAAEAAANLARGGCREPARQLCDYVATVDAPDCHVWTVLCSAYRRLGVFDKAEDAGKRATHIRPTDNFAWYALGRAYEEAGHPESARTAFNRALALKPDYRKAELALGRVSVEARD